MPVYENKFSSDGEVIALIRLMEQADAPVADPQRRGRNFRRIQFSFPSGTIASAAHGGHAGGGGGG